jgi:uncharacterized membrane protein YedE/YeeE
MKLLRKEEGPLFRSPHIHLLEVVQSKVRSSTKSYVEELWQTVLKIESNSRMKLADDIQLARGVIGGVIIGISATYMLAHHNKISGISGIVETALHPLNRDRKGHDSSGLWSWSYIAGLLTSGYAMVAVQPELFGTASSAAASLSPIGVATAGILTGFGTRLGSGCTSGHGICGLPRRSLRSLTAVMTFMATGATTAYLTRVYRDGNLSILFSVEGASKIIPGWAASHDLAIMARPLVFVLGGAFIAHRMISVKRKNGALADETLQSAPDIIHSEPSIKEHFLTFSAGALFALGLTLSGMTDPDRVKNFLDFSGPNGWDPTLAGVMGGGVLFNLVSFEYMRVNNIGTECKGFKFGNVPANMNIDWKLLCGSGIFGVAWGLGGMCPGPALVSSVGAITQGLGNGAAGLFVPFMLVGMALKELLI